MKNATAQDATNGGKGPANGIVLRSGEFRKAREESWVELEDAITKVEKRGLTSLTTAELQRLPVLYRSALSSLSVARSIAIDRNLLSYLENLTLRAYIVVYGPRTGLMASIVSFLSRGFPAAVRGARWHVLIAFITFAAGAAAGFLLTVADPSWYSIFTPDSFGDTRNPDSSREQLLSVIFQPWKGVAATFGSFANALFQHNTIVGILAFSTGFAMGVPTLLLLLHNGTLLGAFVAIHYNKDLTVEILGWLSIHGVTEITAILLCGAAGLMIAERVLFPGRYSRLEALRINGHKAALVAIGAVFLFFVAAILEGGFRQLVQSTELRLLIAGLTGAGWLAYFLSARDEEGRT